MRTRLTILFLLLALVAYRMISVPVLTPYNRPMAAEGLGYYSYLPALFIYQDPHFKFLDEIDSKYYANGAGKTSQIVNVHPDSGMNKYMPGTAVLMAPFFALAHVVAKSSSYKADGFSYPYQVAIICASLFYALCALVLILLFLRQEGASEVQAIMIVCLLALGSNIVHLVSHEPAQSHMYLFFLVTAWLYTLRRWFKTLEFKFLCVSMISLSLIGISRPQNILLLLLIPFAAGSAVRLRSGVASILASPKKPLVLLFLSFLIVGAIPLNSWAQTGEFFTNPYAGEGFHWSDPAVFRQLFSFHRGWFIYTPLAALSLLGVYFLWKKNRFRAASFGLFFLLAIYVFSCWWSWHYASQFGQRIYVDFYALLAIALFYLLDGLKNSKVSMLVYLLCVLFIPLNLIQNYQVTHGLLTPEGLEFSSYRDGFLNLNPQARFNVPYRAIVQTSSVPFDAGESVVCDKQEYCATIAHRLGNAESGYDKRIKVSGKIKATELGASMRCIISITRGQDRLVYNSTELIECLELDKWTHVEAGVRVEDTLQVGDELKVYFWCPKADAKYAVSNTLWVDIYEYDDPWMRSKLP